MCISVEINSKYALSTLNQFGSILSFDDYF